MQLGLERVVCVVFLSALGLVMPAHAEDTNVQGEARQWAAAIQSRNLPAITELSRRGVCIDAADSRGFTALHYAVLADDTNACKSLLQLGADVSVREKRYGRTALMLAATHGSQGCLTLLLSGQVEVNARDYSGATALLLGTAGRHQGIVDALVARGAEMRLFVEEPQQSDAKITRDELKRLELCTEMWAMKRGVRDSAVVPEWKDLEVFLPDGCPLKMRAGKDIVGNRYRLAGYGRKPAVDPQTASLLQKVVDDSFWTQ